MTGVRRRLAFLAGLGCLAMGGAARADIYGFVDDQGTTHFSNVPQDKRYTLFMRTPRAPARAPARQAPSRKASGGKLSSLLRARQQAYTVHVARLASALRMDAAFLHAVITAESGYNPRARSDKGAMGLMQLMPGTAKRYCVKDPYDPVQNLRGGSLYLRDLLERYDNDPRLALAAYNAGEQAVARYGNQIPPYRETREYVPLVMELYERYRRTPGLMQVAAAEAGSAGPALAGRCTG